MSEDDGNDPLVGIDTIDGRNSGPGGAPVIEKLAKRLDEPPTYYVSIFGLEGELQCSWDELWQYRKFQSKAAQKWDHAFDDGLAKQWREKVRQALRSIDKEAPIPDTEELAEAMERLQEFLADYRRADCADEIAWGLPWEDTENQLHWFRLRDAMRFLNLNVSPRNIPSRKQLADAITKKWGGRGNVQELEVNGEHPRLFCLPSSFAARKKQLPPHPMSP